MHRFANGRPVNPELLAADILRLQQLIADLLLILDGEINLADDAPILDNWVIASRPSSCLAGEVSGHPLLPGIGRRIFTSELWASVDDLNCVRTFSRWYRLGRPLGSTQSA